MRQKRGGFTIVELLVVISIIAILMGMLLPALGKSRDQALVTRSQGNLRQIATAHAAYAGEWNDKQFTLLTDTFSYYGDAYPEALTNYTQRNGTQPPWAILGFSGDLIWGLNPAAANVYLPIDFWAPNGEWFGSFRVVNARGFSKYMNGRFYDPVFYAPKDRIVMDIAEQCFDHPGEFLDPSQVEGASIVWSSYCSSPAAMMSPDVLGDNNGVFWRNPWTMSGGFRSPSYGHALYPTLKTHVIEHHWLQNMNKECSPYFDGGTYDGCEPYYFNHSIISSPVTLFYDGHIELIGTMTADNAHKRILAQSNHGLWSKDTPMGGAFTPDFVPGSGGYFTGFAEDWANTNFHILTIDGIRGRDVTSD